MVPVKELIRAKSRLGLPDTGQRVGLAQAFANDVMDACLTAPGVTRVVVVSTDQAVLATARAAGADGITDRADNDTAYRGDALNNALAGAQDWIRHRDPGARIAVIAGDLPCATPGGVGLVLAAADGHPRCFVADHSGTGTTILTANARHQLQPMYGEGSAGFHRRSGAVDLTHIAPVQLRLDVDTRDDLHRAVELGLGTNSKRTLSQQSPALLD